MWTVENLALIQIICRLSGNFRLKLSWFSHLQKLTYFYAANLVCTNGIVMRLQRCCAHNGPKLSKPPPSILLLLTILEFLQMELDEDEIFLFIILLHLQLTDADSFTKISINAFIFFWKFCMLAHPWSLFSWPCRSCSCLPHSLKWVL